MKSQPAKAPVERNTTQQEEGIFIRRVRDLAGVASVVGFVILTGYAFTNLRPGWQWTIEDETRTSGAPADDA